MIGTSLIIITAACILVGVIVTMLTDLVSPSMLFLKEPRYALAFLLIGAVSSVSNVTGNAFVADRKADQYFLQNLFLAFRIPALIPLAFLGVFGIFGSVGLGYLIASLFGLVCQFNKCHRSSPLEVNWDFIRQSLNFHLGTIVSSILSTAPTLINSLNGAEYVRGS